MMVSCPGCNSRYSLDERKVTARGAMLTCTQCGNKLHVRLPSAGPDPAPAETAHAAASPPAPPEIPRSVDASGQMAGSVSCPQCGHAFMPPAGPPLNTTGSSRKVPAVSGRRILIIEDQNYFAELTREALGGAFETTVVANVAAARAAMSGGRFDLIILDLSLEEGQDGAQLLSTIRQRGTPVLVFTARDETEIYGDVWTSLRQAGATDILIKGVNVGEELRQKVTALLSPPRT